jgi:hypothetical protein
VRRANVSQELNFRDAAGLFLVWRFWRQQVSVLLRVEQELFKAFGEFEASGNHTPCSAMLSLSTRRAGAVARAARFSASSARLRVSAMCSPTRWSMTQSRVSTHTPEGNFILQDAARDDVTESLS